MNFLSMAFGPGHWHKHGVQRMICCVPNNASGQAQKRTLWILWAGRFKICTPRFLFCCYLGNKQHLIQGVLVFIILWRGFLMWEVLFMWWTFSVASRCWNLGFWFGNFCMENRLLPKHILSWTCCPMQRCQHLDRHIVLLEDVVCVLLALLQTAVIEFVLPTAAPLALLQTVKTKVLLLKCGIPWLHLEQTKKGKKKQHLPCSGQKHMVHACLLCMGSHTHRKLSLLWHWWWTIWYTSNQASNSERSKFLHTKFTGVSLVLLQSVEIKYLQPKCMLLAHASNCEY